MLNPFIYDRILENVDEAVAKINTYKGSFNKVHKQSIIDWMNLSPEQKKYIIELVEKVQMKSIENQMNLETKDIPLPKLGVFRFNYSKAYKTKNKEELKDLSVEERISRVREYVMSNSRRGNKRNKHEQVISFKKKITKG